MDALLPSEIARLVLGYLQEQKCEEAAKAFLETSPLLQECLVVSQRGGRYSTKVGGLSLMDILDKYCSANLMVQEKLSKVSDSEQMKQCNDLLEQLRYLLEGSSRGHRFVVNISVPQNSPAGPFGSPVVSGSSRKRHHSHSEKGKRASRSLNNLTDKSQQQNLANQCCDTVEATPLESLPGYKSLGHTPSNQNYLENNANISEKFSNKTNFINSSNEQLYSNKNVTTSKPNDPNFVFSNIVNSNCKDKSTETVEKNNLEPMKDKCTAGTSTEELMSYTSAEVQTGSCDLLDTESDVNHDESIQNLGILTKELLNRTELHERIAESINKAILPVETSFREDNTCQNQAEANISLLNDFDNAIKSVVEATETDPVFEGFLHEIFSVAETDTSPDEDSDVRQIRELNNQPSPNDIELMEVEENFATNEPMQSKINDESKGPEVPLKQRLRNSSKPQNINNEDEEKESNTLLENANAEAVMNIVNVIANRRNSMLNEQTSEINPAEDPPMNIGTAASVCSSAMEVEKNNAEVKPKPIKKNVRKPRPKQKSAGSRSEPKPELEVATMPTLILCSERDIALFPETGCQSDAHGYLPIVPKGDPMISSATDPPATIYLRTVNVPRHLVNQSTIDATQKVNPLLQKAFQMQQQSPQKQPLPNDEPIVIPIVVADNKPPVTSSPIVRPVSVSTAAPTGIGESITLYAGEAESTELKVSPISSLPVLSVDESILGIAAGTGLSPFFKATFSNPTEEYKESLRPEEPVLPAVLIESPKLDCPEARAKTHPPELIPIEMSVPTEVAEPCEAGDVLDRSKSADAIITRRTPKTLLRARAKNNRLSLSTPRRRNSHVRALDFNTPVKLSCTARKQPQSCVRTKSVCRAGLFKSPPFASEAATTAMNVHSVLGVQTVKKVRTVSPIKPAYLRVPIATRSPAPKLQGNWTKVAGIGLILEGETSASESSPEKSQLEEKATAMAAPTSSTTTTTTTTTVMTTVVEKKSWDSDLRKIIGAAVAENEQEVSKSKNAKKSTNRKKNVNEKDKEKEKAKTSEAKDKPKEKNKPAKENELNEMDNTKMEVDVTKRKTNEITPPAATTVSKRLVSLKKSTDSEEKQANPVSVKKVSPAMRLPDLLDLETPRKDEATFDVPPTPRILNTPADSLIKTARSKCMNTSIKDCIVDTPDFPVTPCIVHTPRIVDEENLEKKPSPYYEPEEQSHTQKPKEIINAEKIVVQETTTTVTIQRSVVELQESKKLDIKQYEVAAQDTSAETDEKDMEVGIMSEDTSKETIEEEESVEEPAAGNSDSDSDGNESDSSSSSSSSSSNSSTSSSSSCSSADSSPAKSIQEGCANENSTAGSENESPEASIEAQDSAPSEISPQKVFSVMEEGEVKETPAKDENYIVEAQISETPSVTTADRAQRRDSLTNLTSKISAIITTSQSDQAQRLAREEACSVSSSEKNQTVGGSKPKIIKVENIAATDGIAVQVSKLLQGDLHRSTVSTIQQQQQQQMVNAKLGLTLEEKRLRVMAKFKEAASCKSSNVLKKVDDDRQKKAPVTRKCVEAEKIVSSTTDASKAKTKPTPMEVEVGHLTEVTLSETVEKVVEEKDPKVEKKVPNEDKKGEEETKETKKTKGKTSPRKKVVLEQEQVRRTEANEVNKVEETVVSVIPSATENLKEITKAKVDQVKRDLFNDEETNDQRTTRSQTARRSIDTQKSDESQESSVAQESSQEKIPGVLECLQLIPANKSEKEHDLNNKSISEEVFSNLQTNCLDTSVVYDESVPIKKRKRKYSSSELEAEYHFIMNEEPLPHVEILKVIPFEELFKLSPKIKKKIQSPKKSPSKVKRSKTSTKSSPTKSSRSKKAHSEEKKKSCKRKNSSPSKGGKLVEKKPKTDPQILFNRIVIDEFLKSVHVPE